MIALQYLNVLLYTAHVPGPDIELKVTENTYRCMSFAMDTYLEIMESWVTCQGGGNVPFIISLIRLR